MLDKLVLHTLNESPPLPNPPQADLMPLSPGGRIMSGSLRHGSVKMLQAHLPPDRPTQCELLIMFPVMQSQAQSTTEVTSWGCASQIAATQPQHLLGQQLPAQVFGAGSLVVDLACPAG